MPSCTRLDRAGIETRLVDILGCGVGHEVVVLPIHGVALMNGQGCRLKLEPANENCDRLSLIPSRAGWLACAHVRRESLRRNQYN